VNINGQKKIKTARYLLELSKSPSLQIFIVIFTITGIALGYGFGLLSEVLTTSKKENLAIFLKDNNSDHLIATNKDNLYKSLVNKHFEKNTNKKSISAKNKKIESLNLPGTSIIIANTRNNKRVKKNLIENAKNIGKLKTVKKQFNELIPASTLGNNIKSKPKIAIVFDDLGIDMPRSAKVIKLRSPLTLSFMTYASKLKEQTKIARNAGHELWMHMPMEPRSQTIDPGPNVLLTGLPKAELQASISWNLNQFSDYIGINNHMGSRFTADLESVRIFMKELKKRNLMFLDSRTSSKSVAQRAAIEAKVPFIVRNIFIDHIDDTIEIKKSLTQVERFAKKFGYAVAIGHPRDKTLREVGSWLNTFEEKGLQLVPLSKLIKKP
jgi:polysaccharide deacetylase 2 family uncharacterized protein YibQ